LWGMESRSGRACNSHVLLRAWRRVEQHRQALAFGLEEREGRRGGWGATACFCYAPPGTKLSPCNENTDSTPLIATLGIAEIAKSFASVAPNPARKTQTGEDAHTRVSRWDQLHYKSRRRGCFEAQFFNLYSAAALTNQTICRLTCYRVVGAEVDARRVSHTYRRVCPRARAAAC
jgi:hypothetical protein